MFIYYSSPIGINKVISCVQFFSYVEIKHFLFRTHCVEIRMHLTNSMHKKSARNRIYAHRIKNGVDVLALCVIIPYS